MQSGSGGSTSQVAPPGQPSSWEASQGRSASGSYCLRSWNLLKVCQECGCLTHSSLRVHSLKFIKACFPLYSFFKHRPQASQPESAGRPRGQESMEEAERPCRQAPAPSRQAVTAAAIVRAVLLQRSRAGEARHPLLPDPQPHTRTATPVPDACARHSTSKSVERSEGVI